MGLPYYWRHSYGELHFLEIAVRKNVTRQELYDLVWSAPRTQLAKELKVSDVWIAKQCRQARIPMPPPGYWAKLQHGKRQTPPPLPMRLPGQADSIAIGNGYDQQYGRTTFDPDAVLIEPVFHEDINVQLSAALALVGTIQPQRDLIAPHSGLRRVLESERRLEEKYKLQNWSFYKPRFQGDQHQRQLLIFSSLGAALDRALISSFVQDREEWVQGIGNTHSLVMSINQQHGLELKFVDIPKAPTQKTGSLQAMRLTLTVGQKGAVVQSWEDTPGSRIEKLLAPIVEAVLKQSELAMREAVAESHKWRLKQQQDAIRDRERRKQEAERLEEAKLLAKQTRFRDGIVQLAQDRKLAQEIRELVDRIRQRPDARNADPAQMDRWYQAAQAVANEIDPMKKALIEICKS